MIDVEIANKKILLHKKRWQVRRAALYLVICIMMVVASSFNIIVEDTPALRTGYLFAIILFTIAFCMSVAYFIVRIEEYKSAVKTIIRLEEKYGTAE